MEIRKATYSDASKVATVGMCVWVDTYATEGVYEEIARYVLSEFVEEKIVKMINEKSVFVASQENNLIGYAVINSEENSKVELENLYILPKFHRRGLGKLLIEEIIKSTQSPLWLSVWELNNKAIDFYKQQGFKETGELYFDLYGNKIRNIVLELSI